MTFTAGNTAAAALQHRERCGRPVWVGVSRMPRCSSRLSTHFCILKPGMPTLREIDDLNGQKRQLPRCRAACRHQLCISDYNHQGLHELNT